MLVARLLARDEQVPGAVEPVRACHEQTACGAVIEPDDLTEIDVELDLARYLVHVLAARTGRSHRAHHDRVGGNDDVGSDEDGVGHAGILANVMIGLGCMRTTEAATIEAAWDAGIRLFDTARAYAGNEALIGRALKGRDACIVTKGGMLEGWIPDGRARTLREHCDASLEALGGLPIDTYLVHAPDPNVAWPVTVRGLSKLKDERLVKRIGVSNVNRTQLDEALAIAPIEVVEIALGFGNDGALRGGVVARCIEKGIRILAHSPFGGPTRAHKVARDPLLLSIAKKHEATAYEVILAALVDLHSSIVPIPGTCKPERARAFAKRLVLDDMDHAALEERFRWRRMLEPSRRVVVSKPAEVVLVMGIQGSGKSTHVERFPDHERINRDARGGTLAQLHRFMGERIEHGAEKLVLDNTYTTRAMRRSAIEEAHRRGAYVRGIWLDTPIDKAQVNVIRRMIATHGGLLEPAAMQRATDPSEIGPMVLLRTLRALEAPTVDEGFDTLETVPWMERSSGTHAATFVAMEAAFKNPSVLEGDRVCVFGWQPGPGVKFSVRGCPHPGGPPRCWCRPPLPGLLVAYAIENDIDFAKSTLVGTKPHHQAMALAVGARFVAG